MIGSLHTSRAHIPLLLAALLTAAVALWGGGPARAQAPTANFSYAVYLKGWNLVSFGDLTSLGISGTPSSSPIAGPLYTFQPNDTSYESTDLGHVVPGNGYWVNFNFNFSVLLTNSSLTSTQSITLPGGKCAMIGNPSTLGSARVTGADRVYMFSAASNNYIQDTLIGIGRGAWACNDSAQPETVRAAYNGPAGTFPWPDCCSPTPISGNGMGVIVFENDTPAPLIVGVRQVDAAGDPALIADNNFFRDFLPACSACPEYTTHQSCNPAATTVSQPFVPGNYTLHLQSEAGRINDFQVPITIQRDTQYAICFYVSAGR